ELLEIDDGVEGGVNAGDVVALHIVVGIDLPVAVHLERLLADEAVVFERVGFGFPNEIAEALEERHRILGEVREHEAAPGGDADREEAIVLPVEIDGVAEMRRGAQAAGGVVGPAVIAAAEHVAMAGALLQDGRAAMAADVVKGAQVSVAVSDREQAPAREFDGDGVAGVAQLVLAAEPDPFAAEHGLALTLVDLRVVVPRCREPEGETDVGGGEVHGWRIPFVGAAPLGRPYRIIAPARPPANGRT